MKIKQRVCLVMPKQNPLNLTFFLFLSILNCQIVFGDYSFIFFYIINCSMRDYSIQYWLEWC